MCIREAAANVLDNSSAQPERWNRTGRLGVGALHKESNSSGIGRHLSLVLCLLMLLVVALQSGSGTQEPLF